MEDERRFYVHNPRPSPLALRARFAWTFFGLGLFAAINLFLFGAYLLSEALRDPLDATGIAIVTAGFMLALAGFLLVEIVWPRAKSVFEKDEPYEPRRSRHGRVLTIYHQPAHTPLHSRRPVTHGKHAPSLL